MAVNDLLEHVPAHPQGPLPEILATRVQTVEGHEQGRTARVKTPNPQCSCFREPPRPE
jgi:hypothetical protein